MQGGLGGGEEGDICSLFDPLVLAAISQHYISPPFVENTPPPANHAIYFAPPPLPPEITSQCSPGHSSINQCFLKRGQDLCYDWRC